MLFEATRSKARARGVAAEIRSEQLSTVIDAPGRGGGRLGQAFEWVAPNTQPSFRGFVVRVEKAGGTGTSG